VNVFIAGGSGTIGLPLARTLRAAGHQVTTLTRSASRRDELRALGVSVAVADALDRDALIAAVSKAQPTHVVHQLTAIPKQGVRRASDLDATNRLRIEGTRNLLEASINAGVRRFIVGSFAPAAASASHGTGATADPIAAAVRSMEHQVTEATARGAVDGIILRYGLFYGLGSPSTMSMVDMVRRHRLPVVRGDRGRLPMIHLDDAVGATLRALESDKIGTYEIVDDRAVSMSEVVESIAEFSGSRRPFRVPAWLLRLVSPYMARMMSMQLSVSNQAAKAELGWRPRYPTVRDGLAQMFAKAA
jgi:nucleoside-diphosphate-sugar epimerase